MELLKRFKEGDVDAFETLFRQFQAEVYGWIVQIVRDRGVAEDLTIETFWRIYKARTRFDTEAAFGSWHAGSRPTWRSTIFAAGVRNRISHRRFLLRKRRTRICVGRLAR